MPSDAARPGGSNWKPLMWIFVALVIFAFVRVSSKTPDNAPLRPSQVPAAENIGTLKLPPPTKQDLRERRRAYASEFDEMMIEHRIESTTTATGPELTTLMITCALASRVMASDVKKNMDWDRLKELGFRKVYLTNGFEGDLHEGFSWKVQ